jgi:hypothetical protein
MDLIHFMRSFADEIGGHFSEYDKTKSVIIVPLGENRYQTVVGVLKDTEKYNNRTGIEFASKVCSYSDDIDLADLLRENSKFCHAKFVIEDDFIKVEASSYLDNVTADLLKEMIIEVANIADEWEYRATGMDVH